MRHRGGAKYLKSERALFYPRVQPLASLACDLELQQVPVEIREDRTRREARTEIVFPRRNLPQTSRRMKITGFACYALAFACLIGVTNSFLAQDRADPQFPEGDMDAAIKSKRPFCNAFTGCGRKRSYPGSSLESSQGENSKKVRLPVPLYRALLRAATQELEETFNRESSEDYRVQDLPLIYSAYQARNAPLR